MSNMSYTCLLIKIADCPPASSSLLNLLKLGNAFSYDLRTQAVVVLGIYEPFHIFWFTNLS